MNTINEYKPQTVSHPGLTLREKLAELNIGPKEFSIRIDKPEKTVSEVLSGKSSITPDMSVLFESVLKIPAKFWLNRQLQYDEAQARMKRIQVISDAEEWTKSFPYPEMAKYYWVVTTRKTEEKTVNLFNYFGVSNHIAWRNLYLEQQKIRARISDKTSKEPYALSAWIRKGELIADENQLSEFKENNLKEIIPNIKELSLQQPNDFLKKLKDFFFSVGVHFVFVPYLPKAHISGLARWYKGNPLIQVSGYKKRNDMFWFTLFHEIGHVILHGKKEMFLEDFEYSENDMVKEVEADKFAVGWTFSKELENQFLKQSITQESIINFARQNNINPAFIVGRLQKYKHINYNQFNELTQSLNFDETLDKKEDENFVKQTEDTIT